MKVQQTIIIARPIQEVFAYRAALQQAGEWHKDILESDLTTTGAPCLGTRGTECRRGPNGTTEEWELEITEFEPNSALGIVSRCGPVQVQERYLFAPEEADTRCTVCLEMTGSRLPASVLQKRTVDELMNFKWRLEARDYPSR